MNHHRLYNTSRLLLPLIAILLMWCPGRVCGEIRAGYITCTPGNEVYELEGHAALRLVDEENGVDMVVNWGVFDFAAPAFVWRFALGETDYMAIAVPTRFFVDAYTAQHRQVIEQSLNLTPLQASRLAGLVADAIRPENRVYRYRYAHDNCATRPLGYIERAIGDTVIFHDPIPSPATTLREEMRRYHDGYPWYQLGIDIALGAPLDDTIDVATCGFAPVKMRELLAHATITADSTGRAVPLVLKETVLNGKEVNIATEPSRTPIFPTPMTVSIALLVIAAAVMAFDIKRRRRSRLIPAAVFALQGMAGCVVAFLMVASSHYATDTNYLILWLNPLALLVPAIVWWRWSVKTLTVYHVLNILATLVLCVVFLCGLQSCNTAFVPAMFASMILSADYLTITHLLHKQQ